MTRGARRMSDQPGGGPCPETAYTAWVNEEKRVVTFHETKQYTARSFPDRTTFFTELLILAGEGYRFQ